MILKDTEVFEYLETRKSQIESDLRQEFIFDALEARNAMYGIMTNEEAKDADRIAAAKDFLDRAGFKPIDRQEVKVSGELSVAERAKRYQKYLEEYDSE